MLNLQAQHCMWWSHESGGEEGHPLQLMELLPVWCGPRSSQAYKLDCRIGQLCSSTGSCGDVVAHTYTVDNAASPSPVCTPFHLELVCVHNLCHVEGGLLTY
jgi:hypothetical protein